jgi:hypothetical protein
MNVSVARSLTVIGRLGENRFVAAAARTWRAAARVTVLAFSKAQAYLRRRWRVLLEDLRPYECDTVQKRKVHRESWLAEIERGELELRAVPVTARNAAHEARDWPERVAAVEARYQVMRDEFRYLREFSLIALPFDRNGLPREDERFEPQRQDRLTHRQWTWRREDPAKRTSVQSSFQNGRQASTAAELLGGTLPGSARRRTSRD